MRTFTLELQDAAHSERIEGVTGFVGEDRSGQFGIRAHHERMMTLLSFGLARFCVGEQAWEFLALPGGLLHFADNTLTIATSHYLRDTDPERLGERPGRAAGAGGGGGGDPEGERAPAGGGAGAQAVEDEPWPGTMTARR